MSNSGDLVKVVLIIATFVFAFVVLEHFNESRMQQMEEQIGTTNRMLESLSKQLESYGGDLSTAHKSSGGGKTKEKGSSGGVSSSSSSSSSIGGKKKKISDKKGKSSDNDNNINNKNLHHNPFEILLQRMEEQLDTRFEAARVAIIKGVISQSEEEDDDEKGGEEANPNSLLQVGGATTTTKPLKISSLPVKDIPLPLASISPFVATMIQLKMGVDMPGRAPSAPYSNIFDFSFYRRLYADMEGRDNGFMENHFNNGGDREGRLRHPFWDYEKSYVAGNDPNPGFSAYGGDQLTGGKYVATAKTLEPFVVWRGDEHLSKKKKKATKMTCSCRNCACTLRAYSLGDVVLVNAAANFFTQFLWRDKIINFGNIFMTDLFQYVAERDGHVRTLADYIRNHENTPTSIIQGTVFSFFTSVDKFLWHVTHDLFQFLFVYINGGYTCPIIINYTWMHDLLTIFVPSDRIIVLGRDDNNVPYLLKNVIIVKNFHVLTDFDDIAHWAQPWLERARTPDLPTIPLGLLIRSAANAQNPGVIPGGDANNYQQWIQTLKNAGGQELAVGSGGMSFRQQIGMMYTVQTLVTEWGSGMSNAWFMAPGSILFVLATPDRADQMRPDLPMGRFMIPLGVHVYAMVVQQLDVDFTYRLLRKVEEEYRSGFDWKDYLKSLNLHGRVFFEFHALNIKLRRESWPGAERLDIPSDPAVIEAAVNRPVETIAVQMLTPAN